MALARSEGARVGPYSTFRVVQELVYVSTDATGYNCQLRRWIEVVGGTQGFQGTVVYANWYGNVSLYQTGTYAYSAGDVHVNFGQNYTAGSINANYTGSKYYSSTASAISYTPPKPTYTISYNANGGDGAPANQTKTYGTNLVLRDTYPTREGYHFEGWAENASASSAIYQPSGSFTKNATTTLYAVWAIKQYSIICNANGGMFEDESIQKDVIFDWGTIVNIATLPEPTRKNYEFVGWYTEDDVELQSYLNNMWDGAIKDYVRAWAKWKMLANCYIRQNGVYKAGMMYRRENGAYGTGSAYVRKQGEYIQNTE